VLYSDGNKVVHTVSQTAMPKDYSPVKLKNPAAHGVMVRLLHGQKLQLHFEGPQNIENKMEVIGDFLTVDDILREGDGWLATISQNRPVILDNTLYLGCISLFGQEDKRVGSVCVVSKNSNDDVMTVINPKSQFCNVELNQVLDVIVQTDSVASRYAAYPVCGDLCMELIQQYCKPCQMNGCDGLEHVFRFRFDSQSVDKFSSRPVGKFDGGQILFVSSRGHRRTLKLICSWRGKSSVYKALLLPRIPSSNAIASYKKQKKVCLKSDVSLRRIDSEDLEAGCNVLLSKNRRGDDAGSIR